MKIVLTIVLLLFAGTASALTASFDSDGRLSVVSERGSEGQRIFFNRGENRQERIRRDSERPRFAWRSRWREQEERPFRKPWNFEEEGPIVLDDPAPVDQFCKLWCDKEEAEETGDQTQVSAVPLPPSGFLLLGILAGLIGFGHVRGSRTA